MWKQFTATISEAAQQAQEAAQQALAVVEAEDEEGEGVPRGEPEDDHPITPQGNSDNNSEETIAALQAEIGSLYEQLSQAEEQTQKVSHEYRSILIEKEQEISALKKSTSVGGAEAVGTVAAKTSDESLRVENERLKAQVQELQESLNNSGNTVAVDEVLQKEVDQLRGQVQRLQEELTKTVEEQDQQNLAFATELDEVTRARDGALEQLEQLQLNAASNMENESLLQEQCQQLKEQLREVMEASAQKEQELKQKITKVELEREEAKQMSAHTTEVAGSSDEMEGAKNKIKELEESVAALEKGLSHMSSERDSALAHAEDAQSAHTDAEARVAAYQEELAAGAEERSKLTAIIEELKLQISERESADETDRLMEELRVAREERMATEAEVNSLKEENQAALQQLLTEKEALERQLVVFEETKQDAEIAAASPQKHEVGMKEDEFAARIEEVRADALAEAEATILAARQELDNKLHAAEAEFSSKIALLEKELEEARENVGGDTESDARIQELEAALSSQSGTLAIQTTRITQLEASGKRHEAIIAEQNGTMKDLERSVEELEEQLETKEGTIGDLQASIDAAVAEKDQVSAKLQKMEGESSNVDRSNQETIDKLRESLNTAEVAQQKAQEESEKIAISVQECVSVISSATEAEFVDLAEAVAALVSLYQEAHAAQKMIEEKAAKSESHAKLSEEELRNAKSELASCTEKMSSLEKQVLDLQNEAASGNESLAEELQRLRDTATAHEQQASQANAEVVTLKASCESLRTSVEELESLRESLNTAEVAQQKAQEESEKKAISVQECVSVISSATEAEFVDLAEAVAALVSLYQEAHAAQKMIEEKAAKSESHAKLSEEELRNAKSELASCTEKMSSLEKQVLDLQNEAASGNESLAEELQRLRDTATAHEQQASQANAEVEDLNKQLSSARSELSVYSEKIGDLEKQVAESSVQVESSAKQGTIALETLNVVLQEAGEEAINDVDGIVHAFTKALRDRNDMIQESERMIDKLASMEEARMALMSEKESMENEVNNVKQEAASIREELHAEVELANKQARKAKSDYEYILSRESALREVAEQGDTELKSKDAHIDELQSQIVSLRGTVDSLRKELADAAHYRDQSAAGEIGIRDRDMKIEMLETRLRSLEEAGSESVAKVKEVLAAKEGELSKANKELERLRNHLIETEESMTEGELEVAERMSKLQSDLDEARRQLRDYENVKSQLSKADDEATEREAELQRLQQSHDNLQLVLEQFQAAQESAVQAELARVHKQLSAAREETEKSRALALEGSEALELVNAKQGKINELERVIADKDAAKESLQSEVSVLRRGLDEAMTRLKAATQGDENSVDRRLVIKLLVNYFEHPHQRDDVLEIMTKILNFSDDEKSRIGLKKNDSWIGWLVGGSSTPMEAGPDVTTDRFSELWVEFLLKEAQGEKKIPPMT